MHKKKYVIWDLIMRRGAENEKCSLEMEKDINSCIVKICENLKKKG